MTSLSERTLTDIAATVPVPTYDRSKITVGIVHIGVGAFHRAHQAMYLDRLMNAGEALDWGVCGVGVLEQDRRMKDALAAQDGLYTLVVKRPDGSREPRVIGSIVEYLLAPDDPDAVVERMASPEVRIVSLTVTEGGYNVHPVTGEFDESNETMMSDVVAGMTPQTTFGLMLEALIRRRERGVEPFTVMSCDNIPGNGHVAGRMLTAFARLRDPSLADWVATNVHFPNSMVDRITPVTTDQDRAELAERFAIEDAWPVVCEPFTQWVIEDNFGLGRPPMEDADVQLVSDVEPYELMKLRLLNASHQALCYLGYLSGYRYAHEVCADPVFVAFLRGYMDQEGTPTLAPVPGVDLELYKATLIERFSNPEIRDALARLCAESSDRIPTWLLPVIRAQLATGGSIAYATLVVASWARYAEGVDEQGKPITLVDRLSDRLTKVAGAQGMDGTGFISQRNLFGDLVDDPRFAETYTSALRSLHKHGARATVLAFIGQS